jgi:hypothetical protein
VTLVCETEDVDITLVPTEPLGDGKIPVMTFDFMQEEYTSVSTDFIFSHAYCDTADVKFYHNKDGGEDVEMTWVTQSVSENTMKVVVTPTLFEHVGDYTVKVVFSSPEEITITNLFSLIVKNPCTTSEFTYSSSITPDPAVYKFGAEKASYSFSFTDDISTKFKTPNICGIFTFTSYSDTNGIFNVPGNFKDTVVITGDDNSAPLSIEIFSEDYWVTSETVSVSIGLVFDNSDNS